MEAEPKSEVGFSLKMYLQLAAKWKNVFFSPYSISSAMSMLLLGCSGDSAEELMALLEGDDSIHERNSVIRNALEKVVEGMELTSANRLFVSKSYQLLEKFVSDCVEFYGSEAHPLDFVGDAEGSRNHINDWVSKLTKEKIKNLIGQGMINPLTRVILVNAIYFKGKWESQFKTSDTKLKKFHIDESKTVKVEMMSQNSRFRLSKLDDLGSRILELDYKGGAVSMVILLPLKKFDLATVEKKFTLNHLDALNYDMRVKVMLPKFKLEYGCELTETFRQLGVSGIFKGGKDLAGISGAQDLYVSAILHKAFVEVNEEGTEAAAATAVVLKSNFARPPKPEEFICDHPFLFLIREKSSNTVLFMGRYAGPTN